MIGVGDIIFGGFFICVMLVLVMALINTGIEWIKTIIDTWED